MVVCLLCEMFLWTFTSINQFSCPQSMSQQRVLHSRPFLEFFFTKLLFLEQTDSDKLPIVASRKQ
jgi:hypothetical protein